jgi:hypothetical protein
MPFGCPRQIRHKRVASRVPQHGAQWQSRQTVLIYQDPGTENPICRALCTKSADPLTPPPHRPSAHFPHRSHQDPRGFLLPRFVNAGRHLVAVTVAPRPASKNLQGSRRCKPSDRDRLSRRDRPILLKNSSSRKFRRKLGTPFSPRADWQTLFDTGGFYGKIFWLSGPFRRGREFFNRIGQELPFRKFVSAARQH